MCSGEVLPEPTSPIPASECFVALWRRQKSRDGCVIVAIADRVLTSARFETSG
jgi:hypothetical protein